MFTAVVAGPGTVAGSLLAGVLRHGGRGAGGRAEAAFLRSREGLAGRRGIGRGAGRPRPRGVGAQGRAPAW